jgi:hypothetical protein
MGKIRLTPGDDTFVHQLPYTLDTVFTTDPDFRERMWLSISDSAQKDVMIGAGIGHYPNRNIQEAWAGVTVGDQQYNVRMSRHLRPDIQKMQVGPLRLEPIVPLRKMRYILEENPSGVAFDFVFETVFEPHIEDHHLEIVNGRVVHDLSRYNLIGSAEGVVSYPGGERRMTNEVWKGARDHSWGVQPDQQNASQPTSKVNPKGSFYSLIFVQFEHWAALILLHEKAPGIYDYLSGSLMKRYSGTEENRRIVAVEHDYEFSADTSVLEAKKSKISFTTEDGDRYSFDCDFYQPRYFLRSALYMGYKGWWQGTDKGPDYFEHDVWDLSDEVGLPALAVANAGYDHHAICRNDQGETGHVAFEYFMTPGYPKYQDFFANKNSKKS